VLRHSPAGECGPGDLGADIGSGRRRHEEAAAPRRGFAHQLKAGDRVLGPFDHDVLKEITETRLHGALVAGVDLDVVGNRATLIDLAVCLHEHGARGIAVAGAGRVQLFERFQPCLETGELVLARTYGAGAPFVLDTRTCQF